MDAGLTCLKVELSTFPTNFLLQLGLVGLLEEGGFETLRTRTVAID